MTEPVELEDIYFLTKTDLTHGMEFNLVGRFSLCLTAKDTINTFYLLECLSREYFTCLTKQSLNVIFTIP